MPITFGLITGGLTSAAQALTANKKEKEAAVEAKAKMMPKYAGSSALDSYFQQAQQQANVAAQNTALYKNAMNQANRNLGAGLAGSNIAQGGQGLVSKLVQGADDASMRALGAGEQLKAQRFGQLGQATGMKSAEDQRKFQINQMQPFEAQYNLLAAKAAKAAQQQQAGFQNLANLGTTAITAGMYKNANKVNNGGGGVNTVIPGGGSTMKSTPVLDQYTNPSSISNSVNNYISRGLYGKNKTQNQFPNDAISSSFNNYISDRL
jgi:hypothetical protein